MASKDTLWHEFIFRLGLVKAFRANEGRPRKVIVLQSLKSSICAFIHHRLHLFICDATAATWSLKSRNVLVF